MSRMKKLALWTAGSLLLVAAIFWMMRTTILLYSLWLVQSVLTPIGPHQEIDWAEGPAFSQTPPSERPPNIIVILTDDMGFNDISLYNGGAADGSLQTPHIDRLGREGVVFANGYAGSAVCAVSRAALLTGRYATRFGFEFTPTPGQMSYVINIIAPDDDRLRRRVMHEELMDAVPSYEHMGMPEEETTIAELLKRAGYHTVHIGKWHLGRAPKFLPNNQGFDESLLMASGLYLPEDSPDVVNSYQPFDPIDRFLWANLRYAASFNGGGYFEPRGYLTDYYTDEAVKVIEANRHRPFFLYLAHWGIHTPLQALKSDYEALSHIENRRMRVYAAMIRAVDRSVGRIMEALKRHGLKENTLIIFTSDNGGAHYIGLPDVNKPYRGWKLTFFEGGTHVPYMMRWPSEIEAGRVMRDPISHMDIFATAAGAAGATLPQDRVIDGVNLLPFIKDEAYGAPHKRIFWRTGAYHALLEEGWKLQMSERPDKVWLFNLNDDPTEQKNLARRLPKRRDNMIKTLEAHQREQSEPLWPSIVEMPVPIDKTLEDPEEAHDEYIYWIN